MKDRNATDGGEKAKIIHLVSNPVWGGGERYALDLCKGFKAEGYDVQAWCRPGVAAGVFDKEGLLAGTLRLGGWTDLRSAVKLARVLKSAPGPVTVHVHDFKNAWTALAARSLSRTRSRVRVVATRHLVKRAKRDALHTSIYRGLDAMVFVSQLAYDEFMSSRPDVDAAKLHVMHNCVALQPTTPHEDVGDGIFRIGFAGRLVPEKGIEVLLDAVAAAGRRDWLLTVCGTGEEAYVQSLKERASALGISDRVRWEGYIGDIRTLFGRCDAAAVPSVWREPFGLTILEAWSCGIPVVTSDNGAQPEIVTDGKDGILVPPADAGALAAALMRLADDRALRLTMGREALATYTGRFDYAGYVRRMKEVYRAD